MRYRYDGANQRTMEESFLANAQNTSHRIALTVYPGHFERRGLVRGSGTYAAQGTTTDADATETQYMIGGARIVWDAAPDTMGGQFDRNRRATIRATNLLGTTGAVMDIESNELLEVSTYYPSGARENLWTDDAAAPLEPIGFTGKEADEEIGAVYFGERWLIPRLARWATPDPLHVHANGGGEALNSYHYVSGNLLQATDPLGLSAEVGNVTVSPETSAPTTDGSLATTTEGQERTLDADVLGTLAAEERYWFTVKNGELFHTKEGFQHFQDPLAGGSQAALLLHAMVESPERYVLAPVPLMSAGGDGPVGTSFGWIEAAGLLPQGASVQIRDRAGAVVTSDARVSVSEIQWGSTDEGVHWVTWASADPDLPVSDAYAADRTSRLPHQRMMSLQDLLAGRPATELSADDPNDAARFEAGFAFGLSVRAVTLQVELRAAGVGREESEVIIGDALRRAAEAQRTQSGAATVDSFIQRTAEPRSP